MEQFSSYLGPSNGALELIRVRPKAKVEGVALEVWENVNFILRKILHPTFLGARKYRIQIVPVTVAYINYA